MTATFKERKVLSLKERKPNHICRNPNCTKGENGNPKHYYACDYCDRTNTFRAYTCCAECWKEFCEISNGKKTYPIRTDKTSDEVNELYSKPIEQVKKETLEELSDLKSEIAEGGIQKAVEIINENIDKKSTVKAKSRKKTGSK